MSKKPRKLKPYRGKLTRRSFNELRKHVALLSEGMDAIICAGVSDTIEMGLACASQEKSARCRMKFSCYFKD